MGSGGGSGGSGSGYGGSGGGSGGGHHMECHSNPSSSSRLQCTYYIHQTDPVPSTNTTDPVSRH